MRLFCLFTAFLVGSGAAAQERAEKQAQKKKPQARQKQAAHAKPTPEQIRKFNELEKKQKQ